MTNILKKLVEATSEKSIGTIIGEGVVIENATISGSGTIRIDGRFSGTIDLDGHIILGETAIVSGDINADSALFAGKYDGRLIVRNTVHLASNAHVVAHIETDKFIIDEKAIFNGSCNMGTSPAKFDKPETAKLLED